MNSANQSADIPGILSIPSIPGIPSILSIPSIPSIPVNGNVWLLSHPNVGLSVAYKMNASSWQIRICICMSGKDAKPKSWPEGLLEVGARQSAPKTSHWKMIVHEVLWIFRVGSSVQVTLSTITDLFALHGHNIQ